MQILLCVSDNFSVPQLVHERILLMLSPLLLFLLYKDEQKLSKTLLQMRVNLALFEGVMYLNFIKISFINCDSDIKEQIFS